MVTTLSPSPLTASDRCDRCGAQAYVESRCPKGGTSVLRTTHASTSPHWTPLAAHIQDETESLADSN